MFGETLSPANSDPTPRAGKESFHQLEDDGGGVNDLGIDGSDIAEEILPLDLPTLPPPSAARKRSICSRTKGVGLTVSTPTDLDIS